MLTKVCAVSGKEFEITDDDLKFYEKMGVPIPTLCPEERQRRRLDFRNERSLYRRKCDCCDKPIISIFPADSEYKVYCPDCWWSDTWSALDYGVDFDFYRPFFEQIEALEKKIPHLSVNVMGNENCEYVSQTGYSKDCYLVFNSDYSEGCMYSSNVFHSCDCMDSSFLEKCELCFECIDCFDCYNSQFLQNCKNCSDSIFLKNCIGCMNCFGCMNLINKEFYFFNEKHTKEEYEKKIKSLELSKHSQLQNIKKTFQDLILHVPHKFSEISQCEDVSGNHLFHCKNTHHCFDCFNEEDVKYCTIHSNSKDCYDNDIGGYGTELCYEVASSGDRNYHCFFSASLWGNCKNLYYCIGGFKNVHDSFGCYGLQNTEYCIFNKQYSKEEYFKLKDKIIEHMKKTHSTSSGPSAAEWGEFFPIDLSPFAYNETVAQEYFPLTKEECLKREYKWREEDEKDYKKQTYVIQNNIKDVPDSICNELLVCEETGKNYKIQKAELGFYRKMNLPIPRLCPDERHKRRMALRNPRKLWKRKCDKCGIEIETTFSQERSEKVYCEKCYLNVIN